MSDKLKVLAYIKANGSITQLDALMEIGCSRLSARIFDLRRDGYDIITGEETGRRRDGTPTRYARYFMGGSNAHV